MPCGYYLEEAEAEGEGVVTHRDRRHAAVRNGNAFAVDATSFFSRPGPASSTGWRSWHGRCTPRPTRNHPRLDHAAVIGTRRSARVVEGTMGASGTPVTRGVLSTSVGTHRGVHRARLGALHLDRADLGLVVPVHRDRARCVRAGPDHLAAGAVRRRRALARARPPACRSPARTEPGSSRSRSCGSPSVHALPAGAAVDQLGPDRAARRLAPDLRHDDREPCSAAPPRADAGGRAVVGFGGVTAIAAPRSPKAPTKRSASRSCSSRSRAMGSRSTSPHPSQRYGSLPVMARMLGLGAVWTAPLGLAGSAARRSRGDRRSRSRRSGRSARGSRSW